MNRATVRKLYREAILDVFGCGDKELDASLIKALKTDIHLGDKAPGQWAPHSVLEIYCENGIPNATDINDFGAEAIEFGFDPADAVCYNSESWHKVDAIVNLLLEPLYGEKVYHEPCNGGVVNVYWN